MSLTNGQVGRYTTKRERIAAKKGATRLARREAKRAFKNGEEPNPKRNIAGWED